MLAPTARVHRRTVAVPGVVELVMITVDSGLDGPSAVVTANLHGDECTGVGVVHRLRHLLPDRLSRGRVHLFPSLNPGGLRAGTRHLPGDERDPNRSFPGDEGGSAAERLAHALWGVLEQEQPDVVIDLHTDSTRAIPYAILDRVVRGRSRRSVDARCRELAEASGLTVLHEYPRGRYLRYGLDRSLPGALVNGPGIAAVTLEVGPRRGLDPVAVDTALIAALGVLSAAGVLDHPAPRHPSRVDGGPWRRESGPRTSQAGMLEVIAEPGELFPVGEVIARVRSLDGRTLQELTAPQRGFVVAVPDRAWAPAGTACATLAIRDD
ncbi:MAG: succinylglutamate desuccinylase/aspartoacylase family protein [Alphaproteobacteria bacterium]|nr:succinylglutamate desuccinylase/aspartoacylase family protein [Alphaproteobacteria bacterium]